MLRRCLVIDREDLASVLEERGVQLPEEERGRLYAIVDETRNLFLGMAEATANSDSKSVMTLPDGARILVDMPADLFAPREAPEDPKAFLQEFLAGEDRPGTQLHDARTIWKHFQLRQFDRDRGLSTYWRADADEVRMRLGHDELVRRGGQLSVARHFGFEERDSIGTQVLMHCAFERMRGVPSRNLSADLKRLWAGDLTHKWAGVDEIRVDRRAKGVVATLEQSPGTLGDCGYVEVVLKFNDDGFKGQFVTNLLQGK